MYLKNIDLFGFKSFADRTKIDFQMGVAALVGPNGCGKSNIVDSIKWVLGEQSSKTLRASRMEDVIFNGTESRKPLNVAEVTLTFVNDSNMLPIDISEISIKRRLYRSGESEYYINSKPALLREIRELFYDTGIGKSAYSIMEQGRIDQILSTKAEERRYVFEEAAGITKYKMRGQEAERKLQKTEENLKQVEGILGEIKRSYNTLKIQAEKTEKYRAIKEQLFNVEVDIQLLKIKNFMEERNTRQNGLNDKTGERKTLQENIDKINESMESNIELVNTLESDLIEKQKSLYGIDLKKNNTESQMRILRERIGELERKIEYDRSRERTFLEKIRLLREESEKKNTSLEALLTQFNEVENNIRNFKNDIGHFNERIKTNDAEIAQNEADIVRIEEQIEELRVDLRKITDDIVTLLDQKLKETGYSFNERKKIEQAIDEIINSLKVQVSGKANLFQDLERLEQLKHQDLAKVMNSAHSLVKDIQDKLDKLFSHFGNYKKSVPLFIDEFLAPKGIITQKRDIDQKINEYQTGINAKRKRNEELKTENKTLSVKIDEYRKTLENLIVNKARMQTQEQAMRDDLSRIEKEIGEQKAGLEINEREIQETNKSLEAINNKIKEQENHLKQLGDEEVSIKKNLADLEKDITTRNQNLLSKEKDLKVKMNDLLKIQSAIEKMQINLAEINVNIENIYKNFTEQHSRDLHEFENRMYEIRTPMQELTGKVSELNGEIRKCGQVNFMAPEEFLEVKERHDFLLNQVEDLKKAKEDLMKVTGEIRTESAELFLDTYNQIKKNFHAIFRRLFGGGRAELKLDNPDEILQSGIEIYAQPPGKKLESINLLSGGERSLTAIALLFATYMVKPSPFCILDEIDAALDEENVGRFTNLLGEFANTSQFIVITHNKRTIAGTQTLYGITMQESGVSKIIAVRLANRNGEGSGNGESVKSDAAATDDADGNGEKTEQNEESSDKGGNGDGGTEKEEMVTAMDNAGKPGTTDEVEEGD
ncbi:MAG: AAA family ATPase [Spirochaetales bacterium]|nr:AAA family ATPase [Spirochaetales bacterium]